MVIRENIFAVNEEDVTGTCLTPFDFARPQLQRDDEVGELLNGAVP